MWMSITVAPVRRSSMRLIASGMFLKRKRAGAEPMRSGHFLAAGPGRRPTLVIVGSWIPDAPALGWHGMAIDEQEPAFEQGLEQRVRSGDDHVGRSAASGQISADTAAMISARLAAAAIRGKGSSDRLKGASLSRVSHSLARRRHRRRSGQRQRHAGHRDPHHARAGARGDVCHRGRIRVRRAERTAGRDPDLIVFVHRHL